MKGFSRGDTVEVSFLNKRVRKFIFRRVKRKMYRRGKHGNDIRYHLSFDESVAYEAKELATTRMVLIEKTRKW